MRMAPAFLTSRVGDRLKAGDKVTIDNKTWAVWSAIDRSGIYIYSDLYLFQDRDSDTEDLTANAGANVAPPGGPYD